MDINQLAQTLGAFGAIMLLAAWALTRHLDRKSKVVAHQEHSRLDDTETLRELSKEDRELLRFFQNRNDELTKSNIALIQDQAQTKTDLELVKRDLAERMSDCTEMQGRMREEIEVLKEAVREMRENLQECYGTVAKKNEELSQKDAIIAQLRAS